MTKWFVVGISGVTGSGKTTLATSLNKTIDNSIVLNQDDYFFDKKDKRHTLISELNHVNYDIISSMDMEKMYNDIIKIIKCNNDDDDKTTRVLILDGFLLFDCQKIADICNLKYFLILDKDECIKRREKRVYDPPDVPGYFDIAVWPGYINYKRKIQDNKYLNNLINYIDGTTNKDTIYQQVHQSIINKI
ncbi:nicotinamide riboside kinase 1 [Aphidius gifuensis]|uniref:nicotinamide riboside kinase 1 n=1 Tax=Aphidius gifuensis TaxID=684658 RepID=UPI001CDD8E91|nr:nicotinamide riboside kinase 1 [Aphidius gifuensis]